MKSKEKPEFDFEEAFTEYELSQIRAAMRQEAIAFINFVAPCDYMRCGKIYSITMNPHGFASGNYTTEELYDLFLQSKKQ